MSVTVTRQAGFTLIELLVSLVVGMTLVVVAGSLYSGVVSSRVSVAGETELRETGYYLSRSLNQHLQQAGYRSVDPVRLNSDNSFPIPDTTEFFDAVENEWAQGQYVRVDGQNLAIRFGGATTEPLAPDHSIVDCTGSPSTFDAIEVLEFTVANNQLTCIMEDGVEVLAGNDLGTVVEQMVVNIGVDDDEDRSADRYVTGALATQADMLSAVAIDLRLLLASADKVASSEQTYTFNGVESTADDLRKRSELVVFVALRN